MSHLHNSIVCVAILLAAIQSASAQDSPAKEFPADSVIAREQSATLRLRVGVRLRAEAGSFQRGVVTFAVPIEWPEQQVKQVASDEPKSVQSQPRKLGDSAEQLVLRLPGLAVGSDVQLARTYEITRWTQRLRPEARERLQTAPASPKLREYLQPSDGIESSHAEIRRFAADAIGDTKDPLDRVTALFNATRERIKYVEGDFKGALAGLRAGEGDCEERSCLFIAACRASGIPARLVWGPQHAWTEIALADSDGKLVWIPADPTKETEVGTIRHAYPILQKGDRFKVPELGGKSVRYLAPQCTGTGSAPRIESIEEVSPNPDKAFARDAAGK